MKTIYESVWVEDHADELDDYDDSTRYACDDFAIDLDPVQKYNTMLCIGERGYTVAELDQLCQALENQDYEN